MKKRIENINPVQLGIVQGALAAMISLIFVPFLLLFSLLGLLGGKDGFGAGVLGMLLIVFIPVLYGIAGFIGGLIAGFAYNLVAKFTGGIEFTLSDPPTV